MPFYEYKCPNGHLLEVFHSMSESGPRKCEVCGASPMVRVLFPVAVHYKGSGFYSTDYGRGGKKASKEGGSSSDSGGGSSGGGDAGGGGSGGDGGSSTSSGSSGSSDSSGSGGSSSSSGD
jgi:putative FmdB family regulatory protein